MNLNVRRYETKDDLLEPWYERARHRVEEIKGFYIHLIVYIFVNIAMFLVNILSSPEELM